VKGSFGKIGTLFGGKQPPAEEAVRQEEIRPELSVEAQPAVQSVKGPFGKIGNLFGGKQPQAEDTTQEEVQPLSPDNVQDDESAEKSAGFSKQLKGIYRKFSAKSE